MLFGASYIAGKFILLGLLSLGALAAMIVYLPIALIREAARSENEELPKWMGTVRGRRNRLRIIFGFLGLLAIVGTITVWQMEAQAIDIKLGGIYSYESGDGGYRFVKVLAVREGWMHVREYKNRYKERPATIDRKELQADEHVSLSYAKFYTWDPQLLLEEKVAEEELEDYHLENAEEKRNRERFPFLPKR